LIRWAFLSGKVHPLSAKEFIMIVDPNTLLVRVAEDGSTEYPLRLSDMKRCFPNTWLPSEDVESELLESLGVFVVELTERPVADVVTELPPVLDEEVWRQAWFSRSYTPEETQSSLDGYKAKHLLNIEAWRVAQFRIGFPFLAPDAEIYHVQIRDTDRVNILGRYTKAKEAIAENKEVTFEFRMYENVSVTLTPEEMVEMGNQSDAQVLAGYQLTWSLKDQTTNATTFEEIPPIPDEMFTAL